MDPADIDLSMIVNTLEGKNPLLDCLVVPDGCKLSDACAQQEVWRSFEEAVQELLSSTTIADMALRQRHLVASRTL